MKTNGRVLAGKGESWSFLAYLITHPSVANKEALAMALLVQGNPKGRWESVVTKENEFYFLFLFKLTISPMLIFLKIYLLCLQHSGSMYA